MGFPGSADIEGLIARVASELERRGLPFMVIGGQAVLVHGEPRLTQDIDITLGAGPADIGDVIAACEALELETLPEDPAAFARRTFVLPAADPAIRIRVDFIFSTTPYERLAISRAVSVPVGGVSVPYASAEDLLIHKLFAGRPRDVEDARGVVARQGERLDWDYVERWAREFSLVEGKETLPELVARLRGGE
jgi:hypothetical protein